MTPKISSTTRGERGFVEQHDLGLRHQRAADDEHLLLAARESPA
jgi:hypothetical protein